MTYRKDGLLRGADSRVTDPQSAGSEQGAAAVARARRGQCPVTRPSVASVLRQSVLCGGSATARRHLPPGDPGNMTNGETARPARGSPIASEPPSHDRPCSAVMKPHPTRRAGIVGMMMVDVTGRSVCCFTYEVALTSWGTINCRYFFQDKRDAFLHKQMKFGLFEGSCINMKPILFLSHSTSRNLCFIVKEARK